MDSPPPASAPAPLRRSTGRLLTLAYVPFVVYSVAGAGWMLWHNIAAIVLLFVWIMIVGLFGLLIGSLATAAQYGGLAACHLLAAFAMRPWLHLPRWAMGLFLFAAFALLSTMFVRALIASGSADYPYDE
ncbi:MAG TPA: hypothetical protein VIQ54_02140 [Polyangia bacterium]|jgi:hypothetical protein